MLTLMMMQFQANMKKAIVLQGRRCVVAFGLEGFMSSRVGNLHCFHQMDILMFGEHKAQKNGQYT